LQSIAAGLKALFMLVGLVFVSCPLQSRTAGLKALFMLVGLVFVSCPLSLLHLA
jgi:hypothetical protein